jgi:hypothetical protein
VANAEGDGLAVAEDVVVGDAEDVPTEQLERPARERAERRSFAQVP